MQSLINKQNIVKITPKKPIFYILTSSNLIIFKRLLLQSCLPYQKELKNIFFKFFKISSTNFLSHRLKKTTIFDIHSPLIKISQKFLSPSCRRYRSRLKNIHFIKISLTSTNFLTQILFLPKKRASILNFSQPNFNIFKKFLQPSCSQYQSAPENIHLHSLTKIIIFFIKKILSPVTQTLFSTLRKDFSRYQNQTSK